MANENQMESPEKQLAKYRKKIDDFVDRCGDVMTDDELKLFRDSEAIYKKLSDPSRLIDYRVANPDRKHDLDEFQGFPSTKFS